MLMALLGPGHFHARGAARGPAAHHRVRDLGMKLDRVSRACAKGLDRKHVAFGKQLGATRQVKTFAVPLILIRWPIADRAAGRSRPHRIVPDLGLAFGMRRHALAEMPREHLRAETDAEE